MRFSSLSTHSTCVELSPDTLAIFVYTLETSESKIKPDKADDIGGRSKPCNIPAFTPLFHVDILPPLTVFRPYFRSLRHPGYLTYQTTTLVLMVTPRTVRNLGLQVTIILAVMAGAQGGPYLRSNLARAMYQRLQTDERLRTMDLAKEFNLVRQI
ncbi:hypothetical protein Pmani_028411 [Petrolisthes manimaculis]|uniref:Uncharacterized protein n=1 Tax=Petrolisthes manimaculis TaxID=1843537 RepID=A0AAE1P065_9EUCA|nr:hypothetical protein Pmani_028411 [Petrolisthes manimaculis]